MCFSMRFDFFFLSMTLVFFVFFMGLPTDVLMIVDVFWRHFRFFCVSCIWWRLVALMCFVHVFFNGMCGLGCFLMSFDFLMMSGGL